MSDTWLQGRSLFGGLQAAVAVRAMRAVLAADPPLSASSMTWTIEMLRDSVAELSLCGYRLDAELVVMVWGPGGEPVALSRQSMVVFG